VSVCQLCVPHTQVTVTGRKVIRILELEVRRTKVKVILELLKLHRFPRSK